MALQPLAVKALGFETQTDDLAGEVGEGRIAKTMGLEGLQMVVEDRRIMNRPARQGGGDRIERLGEPSRTGPALGRQGWNEARVAGSVPPSPRPPRLELRRSGLREQLPVARVERGPRLIGQISVGDRSGGIAQ